MHDAIQSGSAVFVVGTGASMAATRGAATANWVGLLQSGLDTIAAVSTKSPKWLATVSGLLDAGVEPDGLEFLIQGASSIGEALRDIGGTAYSSWLRTNVGSLELADAELAFAICSLPIPILTTNYDDLLERASDRRATSWKHPNEMQAILANLSLSVGHLHGIWDDPDSVVLTISDYAALINDDAAQAIQIALGTSKTLIYVGVGAGLLDPNFERFVAWQRTTFTNPGIRNFRLCTLAEQADLIVQHRADNIELVVYGESHDLLPGYLRGIAESLVGANISPVGLVTDPSADARALFSEDLRAEIVVGQDQDGTRHLPLDEMMLTPVLLAVPHVQYVSERMSPEGSNSLSRLDPEKDFDTEEILLLAGEEHSGLSFAAKWMALRVSERRQALTPLYVNFTSFRKVKPLAEEVRRQARTAGLGSINAKNPLPPIALVIDDYSPYLQPISDRVLADLSALQPAFTVVTCRQGDEDDVKQKLEAAGFKVKLRYVGKLEPSDIAELARIISPQGSEKLTETVMALLRTEHLPRTPYTVSQLLYILLRGGALGSNASSTSVLEEYVALLLGRGDATDDSRFGLDYVQREAILERLAERLVNDDTIGLSDSRAVSTIEDILRGLSWPEMPVDVLKDFLDRRVLARKGRNIVFARGSFLHLFAAKQAQKSPDFRDHLLSRPLYYSSAITDYASLNRHDIALLDRMTELLTAIEWVAPGRVFAELALVEPNFDPLSTSAEDEPTDAAVAAGAPSPLALSDLTDDDPPPFPVSDEEDIPEAQRRTRIVELASRVVRDADQAGSPQQKIGLLLLLLKGWGGVMNELGSDPTFQMLLEQISKSLEAPGEDALEMEKDLIQDFDKIFPAIVAYAGVSSSLASRKLLVAMDDIIDNGQLVGDPEGTVIASFFLMCVAEKGWPARVQKILVNQPNTWAIRDFVLFMLFAAYLSSDNTSDNEHLLQTAVEIIARGTHYKDDHQRRRHAAIMRANFVEIREKERLKARAREAIAANAIKAKGELV